MSLSVPVPAAAGRRWWDRRRSESPRKIASRKPRRAPKASQPGLAKYFRTHEMSRTTRTPSLSPWFAKHFSEKMVTRSPGRGFRPTSGASRTTITPLGTLPGARIPSPGAGEPACRVWWAGAAGERSGRRRRGAHRASRKSRMPNRIDVR